MQKTNQLKISGFVMDVLSFPSNIDNKKLLHLYENENNLTTNIHLTKFCTIFSIYLRNFINS